MSFRSMQSTVSLANRAFSNSAGARLRTAKVLPTIRPASWRRVASPITRGRHCSCSSAMLGGREGAECGLVLLQHPEYFAALFDDAEVPAQHGAPRFGRSRLAAAPVDERVDLAEVVLDQAADDVFLGFEVVVQGRL